MTPRQRHDRREAQRRLFIMAAGWATLALLGVVWVVLSNAALVDMAQQ